MECIDVLGTDIILDRIDRIFKLTQIHSSSSTVSGIDTDLDREVFAIRTKEIAQLFYRASQFRTLTSGVFEYKLWTKAFFLVDIENEFDISNHILECGIFRFESFLFADMYVDCIKPGMMSNIEIMNNALDICFAMGKRFGEISKIVGVDDSSDLLVLLSQR